MSTVATFPRRPRRAIVIRRCTSVWVGFEVGAFDARGELLQIGSLSKLHRDELDGCLGYASQLFRACRLPIVVGPSIGGALRKRALAILHNPERSRCDPLPFRVRRDERMAVQVAL